MSNVQNYIGAFAELGRLLRHFDNDNSTSFGEWPEKLKNATEKAHSQNSWFTMDNLHHAMHEWGQLLTEDGLNTWLKAYGHPKNGNKTIGVIMAGNIPMVGFHDFICILLSGNKVLAKLSTNDNVLLPFMADFLVSVCPELANAIEFTQGKLEGFDAVIATGSDNTSRYFDYYFGKYPNIIRKNRNSVAVLTGTESQEDLTLLGEDIFRYFGLGCRSVSKLYVPAGYDFQQFFGAVYKWKSLIDIHKYANNYDYNKAVYLMSDFKILDNGFLLLKEDVKTASPIATLFYEEYTDAELLKEQLEAQANQLQCVVSKGFLKKEIGFGSTQKPQLHDYADGVDSMQFLWAL